MIPSPIPNQPPRRIADPFSGSSPTMSSREIAERTGKDHKNVLADIRTMLDGLGMTSAEFSADVPDSYGRPQPAYLLPKRECLILISGYSVELRAAIIDRWQELEDATRIAVPNFSDPVAAARAWADAHEARQIAERTKAEIGTRREATAMNTASQAVKRANRLEVELDRNREYATIKRMEMLYHGQSFAWRRLKGASADVGIPPIDIFDANYGTVKAYHAEAWREAYALEIPGEF